MTRKLLGLAVALSLAGTAAGIGTAIGNEFLGKNLRLKFVDYQHVGGWIINITRNGMIYLVNDGGDASYCRGMRRGSSRTADEAKVNAQHTWAYHCDANDGRKYDLRGQSTSTLRGQTLSINIKSRIEGIAPETRKPFWTTYDQTWSITISGKTCSGSYIVKTNGTEEYDVGQGAYQIGSCLVRNGIAG
jgi:hypothetical protein